MFFRKSKPKETKLSISEQEAQQRLLAKKSQMLRDLALTRTVQRITPIEVPVERLFFNFLSQIDRVMPEKQLRIREQENYGFYQISVTLRNAPIHYSNEKRLRDSGIASDWKNFRSKPENLYENWAELEADVKFQLLDEEAQLLLLADALESSDFEVPEDDIEASPF